MVFRPHFFIEVHIRKSMRQFERIVVVRETIFVFRKGKMKKFKSFIANKKVISTLLIVFILGASFFIYGQVAKFKDIAGVQTQVIQPKIEMPKSELPKPTETKSEPVVAPTKTPTNKSLNTQSTTPQPTSTPASSPTPQPTPTPVVTCDEGEKYKAIDAENFAYNQYVQNENTRHTNREYQLMHWCDGQPSGSTCPLSIPGSLATEEKNHEENLAKLLSDHEVKLAEINGRCY